MIIRIGKNNYRISKNLAVSSKKMIQQILLKVKEESDARGIHEYYVSFVVMMYVVSSTLLSEFSEEKIREIIEKTSEN